MIYYWHVALVNKATRLPASFLTEAPPEVPTNFSISIESDSAAVNISITWDSAFNLVHNVTSYRVVASGGSAASCPSSCDPSSPCKCTGLEIGENITIMISAINCGDRMGPAVVIRAKPQGSHNKTKFD